MQQENRILQLCARVEPHTGQQEQLLAECSKYQSWDELLLLAEKQGMAPLLHRHLSLIPIDCPTSFLRGLKFLALRHSRANSLLMETLGEILLLFEAAGIRSLVVKGAALCNTLYPEIGLRPMRDIDLLLHLDDLKRAYRLLQNSGYKCCSIALPEGHYHLPPLLKNSGGLEIAVELHSGLFPKLPPYYREFSFNECFADGSAFQVNGVQARTLADEEMLWHLFQHGFHPPLTYESCKLISAADIITLVEKNYTSLDWQKIERCYPQLLKSLPLFHKLSPWSKKVLQRLPPMDSCRSAGAAYAGWPRCKYRDAAKSRSVLKLLGSTFFPSRWWCMVYYSTGESLLSLVWCRLCVHPLHLLRWVKITARKFFTGTRMKE